MNLIAKPPFGTDTETITDDQHADHQLRVDRRTADRAVVRLQILPDALKVNKHVDLTKQVITRNGVIKAKS